MRTTIEELLGMVISTARDWERTKGGKLQDAAPRTNRCEDSSAPLKHRDTVAHLLAKNAERAAFGSCIVATAKEKRVHCRRSSAQLWTQGD